MGITFGSGSGVLNGYTFRWGSPTETGQASLNMTLSNATGATGLGGADRAAYWTLKDWQESTSSYEETYFIYCRTDGTNPSTASSGDLIPIGFNTGNNRASTKAGYAIAYTTSIVQTGHATAFSAALNASGRVTAVLGGAILTITFKERGSKNNQPFAFSGTIEDWSAGSYAFTGGNDSQGRSAVDEKYLEGSTILAYPYTNTFSELGLARVALKGSATSGFVYAAAGSKSGTPRALTNALLLATEPSGNASALNSTYANNIGQLYTAYKKKKK